jgi:hypothetical protein
MSSAAIVDVDPGATVAPITVTPELGLAGRIGVIALVIAGALVAATSGFGLIFFLPYAAVGALLAIRRPHTSIGWILLAMAGSFAFGTAKVDATVQQFADGTVAPPVALFAFAEGGSFAMAFYLFAVLGIVFPTGRLPTGRWGTASRLGIGLGLLITASAFLAPVISVGLVGSFDNAIVRNPFALLPDAAIWPLFFTSGGTAPPIAFFVVLSLVLAAAISLIVRARRAVGIERQQLRWFAASIAAVVVAVIAGLALFSIVSAMAGGVAAWIPAIVAFVCVPISIGIAVLRYRLYQIDTIVNRAIVYGLLTAILAGIYAASVALMQKLFGTLTGQTSDAAIVLTTLVVVVAFSPIRSRLQAVVDRRFKEVRDPTVQLAEFVDVLRARMWPLQPPVALRHLLDVGTAALGAASGDVTMGAVPVAHTGSEGVVPEMVVAAGEGSGQIVLSIGPRHAGPPYVERDRAALVQAVEALAVALASE